MNCSALMVVMDSGSEKYMSVDMKIMDGIMPQNNSRDIIRIVDLCNKHNTEDGVVFIDMYGLITKDKTELWEIEDGQD